MSSPNTLFLIARFGLKGSDIKGILESWMWILEPLDYDMDYVSFHKSKSDRAMMGGKVVGFRSPTQEEYEFHQAEMRERDEGEMKALEERTIIRWQRSPNWSESWPLAARSNPMAYRANDHVDPEKYS